MKRRQQVLRLATVLAMLGIAAEAFARVGGGEGFSSGSRGGGGGGGFGGGGGGGNGAASCCTC